MQNEQETVSQENQNDNSKTEKQFKSAMNKLTAMLKGDKTVYSAKIPNSELAGIIDEMTKKRKEKAREEFSEEASKIIDEVIAHEKFVKQKQQEFNKAVSDRKNELTKKINSLTSKLENIAEIEKQYAIL